MMPWERRATFPVDVLPVWVIYDHPKDHPDGYVLRAQFAGPDGAVTHDTMAWKHTHIEPLRELVKDMWLHPLGRQPGDDPAIAEVWV